MNSKAPIIIAFVGVAAIIIFFAVRGDKNTGDNPNKPNKPNALLTDNTAAGPQTEISVLYSSEKKEWMEAATAEFSKQNPNIKVTLKAAGSLKAKEDILDGKEKPTIFSPADSEVLNLFLYGWDLKHRSEIVAQSGDDAPAPLLLTPLVFVVWDSRAKVLDPENTGLITWTSIHEAIQDPKGWLGKGGKADWGFIKLGHTDPTSSNSGLQALLLMTLEYHKKTSGLKSEDVLNTEYQTWIKEIEKGVSKFETSTNAFMTDMVRLGPSKYDISAVYESLAITQLKNAIGRWEPLKVYYPPTTLWSDHPIVLLKGEWVTEPQKVAGRTFIAFLKSRPMQERALDFGFRPADVSVPLNDASPQNPFNELASLGVRVDIPPVATPPDGVVIENLLTMWTRQVGQR